MNSLPSSLTKGKVNCGEREETKSHWRDTTQTVVIYCSDLAPRGYLGGFIYMIESLSTVKLHGSYCWQLVMTVSKHWKLLVVR